jgi:N-acetylmuramoyl-L-alanine amidase
MPAGALTAPEPVAPEPSNIEIAKEKAPAKPKAEASVKPEIPRSGAPGPPAAGPEVVKAAKRTSSGESSLVRALGLKLSRVVIDPGHGGHDQGTEGPHGLLEKDLVLDVAQRLGALIEQRLGAEVIFTRSDDTFIPLEGRTALANEKKADLFLSIHANSSSTPRIAGVETFYLNISGTKDALDVASRENASSQKSIFELTDLIQKIAKHDKSEESREFAGRIQTALYAFSARNIPGSKNRGVKSAPFVVLIGANMPSILAEIGFLSNPKEEVLLKKPDYRQKLADALCRGVSRYADSLSHFQMAQTPAMASVRP